MSSLAGTGRGGAATRLLGSPLRVAILVGIAILAVTAAGKLSSTHSLGYFTRDPAAITDEAAYMGMVSFFGLFGWCAAATSLFFGGYLASLRGAMRDRTAFFVGAVAVVYLMLDDAFQFHEYVYPRALGVHDKIVEAVYVVVAIVLLYRGRAFVSVTNWRLLVVAGVFFAISVGLDEVITSDRVIGFEDSAKLIGILLLAAYAFEAAMAEVGRAISARTASSGEPPEIAAIPSTRERGSSGVSSPARSRST